MPLARFLGTGFAVPDRVVTNDDLSQLMDTSDEWIRTRTGHPGTPLGPRGRDRRGAGPRGDACARSRRPGSTPADLDAIVYATSTPDHFAPGNGVFLQRLLGVGTIPSIDIRNQCSGFVYALSVADAFIRCGQYRHVLVVGAEIQSTAMDVTTRGRNTAVHLRRRRRRRGARSERGRPRHPGVRPARRGSPRGEALGGLPRIDVPPARLATSRSSRAGTSWRWTARKCSGTRWSGCRSRCGRPGRDGHTHRPI